MSTTFTGRKLDWCKCVRFDPRLQPTDKVIAATIADHINERSGIAQVSDETIAIKTSASVSTVIRSRRRLREAGWLNWRRTQKASRYSLCFDKVSGVLDMITAKVEASRERRLSSVICDRTGPRSSVSDARTSSVTGDRHTP